MKAALRGAVAFFLAIVFSSTQHGVFRHHSCGQGLRAVAVGGAAQVFTVARLGSAQPVARRLDSAARHGSVGDLARRRLRSAPFGVGGVRAVSDLCMND